MARCSPSSPKAFRCSSIPRCGSSTAPGRGNRVELSTTKGAIAGRYCIITASTNAVLDRIKFDGGLPKRQQDALEKLKLGSFDHIALELTGNPLGLQRDDLVFEKSSGARTGALLANVGGSPLSVVSVGGKFGRDLAEQGDKAMVEFAVEWLSGLFGPNVKKAVGRTQTTQWSKEQWTQGAIATASPGWQGARRILMEPLRNRVFFAGEAVHETAWGTVGGAWESGTRAADAVVRRVLGQPEPAPPKAEPEPVRGSGRAAQSQAAVARELEAFKSSDRGYGRRASRRRKRRGRHQRANCSFSQPTMVLAISSGCWPGVRPM